MAHQSADAIVLHRTRWSNSEPTLRMIRQTVFIEEQQVPFELEWDEHDASSWHILAAHTNQPAGCGRLQPNGKLTRIAVLKHYRKQGIASLIIAELLDIATQNRLETPYLHAQINAVSLYEKFGFEIYDKPFEDAGIKHIGMRRVTSQ